MWIHILYIMWIHITHVNDVDPYFAHDVDPKQIKVKNTKHTFTFGYLLRNLYEDPDLQTEPVNGLSMAENTWLGPDGDWV